MFTVKDLSRLLSGIKEAFIAWDGLLTRISFDDALQMDAYGMYIVQKVVPIHEGSVEIYIDIQPMKRVIQ